MTNDNEVPLRVLYGEVFISGNIVLTERELEPLKRPQLIERLKSFINQRADNHEWLVVEPSDGERMRDINWKMVHENYSENYALIRSIPAAKKSQ